MTMELLSTGIRRLDRAIGGGLIPNGNLLIIHNTYSTGWTIAFEIMRNRVEMGDFGVVTNTVLPLSTLEIELVPSGVDLRTLGESGDLAVIDVFGSLHGIKYNEDFVYSGENLSADTFVPKYSMLFRTIEQEKMDDQRVVRVDFTLDGFAFFLGERNTLRIFQRFMALSEADGRESINLWILNRDRTSEKFLSWFSLYAHYVVEVVSREGMGEQLYVRKSPLLYTPREKGMSIERGRSGVILR
ncbi:hypothetical protein [Thermococcus prieurii]